MELVVGEAIKKAKLEPIDGPVSIRLIWFAPDARSRDVDSLAPMMKACLDALVKRQIISDDNWRIVHEALLGPVVIARDNPRFELRIRKLGGPGGVCNC